MKNKNHSTNNLIDMPKTLKSKNLTERKIVSTTSNKFRLCISNSLEKQRDQSNREVSTKIIQDKINRNTTTLL